MTKASLIGNTCKLIVIEILSSKSSFSMTVRSDPNFNLDCDFHGGCEHSNVFSTLI